MHELINWLLNTIGALGYPGIFLLMAMESSVIPVPSELVMPPAGYLAQQGQMNMAIVILCGTAGSLVGAYANYYAAHYLGRPLILKYGKYVWITEEKFAKVETVLQGPRRGVDLHRQASAGGASPDLAPRGACGHEPSEILSLYAARRGAVGHGAFVYRLFHRREPGADHAVFASGAHRGRCC